ncbi:MAG: DUF4412 domain-containing protein [Acidobacteriota bacterium]
MRRSRCVLLVLAVVSATLGFVPGMADAGVVFEVETTDHAHDPPRSETTQAYAEGRNLKMDIAPSENTDQGRGSAIFRGERGDMMVIDDDEQSYYVVDQEMVRQIAGEMGGVSEQLEMARRELEKHLGDLDPEQRRALEQALGNPAGGAEGLFGKSAEPSTVRKTGERGTRAGYPCVRYEVVRGERVVRELWVTDWSRIEGGDEARPAFEAMGGFFRELTGMGLPSAGFEDLFPDVDGFPVVGRSFGDDGELESEWQLRSSQRRRLDPADFEPPAGYKRRSMPH